MMFTAVTVCSVFIPVMLSGAVLFVEQVGHLCSFQENTWSGERHVCTHKNTANLFNITSCTRSFLVMIPTTSLCLFACHEELVDAQ